MTRNFGRAQFPCFTPEKIHVDLRLSRQQKEDENSLSRQPKDLFIPCLSPRLMWYEDEHLIFPPTSILLPLLSFFPKTLFSRSLRVFLFRSRSTFHPCPSSLFFSRAVFRARIPKKRGKGNTKTWTKVLRRLLLFSFRGEVKLPDPLSFPSTIGEREKKEEGREEAKEALFRRLWHGACIPFFIPLLLRSPSVKL